MAEKLVEPRAVPDVWLSVEQVAEVLELPRTTVYRWARDGDARLPAYQVWDDGNSNAVRFRFKKSDLEAFQALPAVPDAAPPAARAVTVRRRSATRSAPRAAKGE
jgi:excisionase family DNA binding protein